MLLLQSRVEAAEKLRAEREGEAIASKRRAAELEAGGCQRCGFEVGCAWTRRCACLFLDLVF